MRLSASAAAWRSVILTVAALTVLIAGCERRQEIIEQTVQTKAQGTIANIENSRVPVEMLTWEMVAEVDHGFSAAAAVAFGPDGTLYIAGDQAVSGFSPDGATLWSLPLQGAATALHVDAQSILVGLKDRVAIYDLATQQWAEIAPLSPHYSMQEAGRTWVTSIASNGDRRFFADAGNRRIIVYDSMGQSLGEVAGMDQERGIPPLAVPSPHLDVAMGFDGNLWLSNPGRRSIQVHSLADGSLVSSWGVASNAIEGFGGCCNPTDIALLPDGRVVTAEKGIPRVKVMSADGALLSVVVPPNGFSQTTAGIDLAADQMGQVVVLDPLGNTVRLYAETVPLQVGDR
ncbi:MAG: hypothetical protein GX131_12545 [candidate division WS1 bacterium]|jgi:hypothetical protein|nr:hypothetical protein [candidate division WS1 bacterium]